MPTYMYIGQLGGSGGSSSSPNPQSLLLTEWADSCQLYVASISTISGQPDYTNFNGKRRTTVDYIFVDPRTAQHLRKCYVHMICTPSNSEILTMCEEGGQSQLGEGYIILKVYQELVYNKDEEIKRVSKEAALLFLPMNSINRK